jgi:hypothetical protein
VAWAVLNGVELPATLPEAFTPDAQRYGFGDLELWDVPQEISPDLRAAVSEYAARQVDAVHRAIFPFHGL